MLRRELAQILIAEEVRDPRLRPLAALSITAVQVSGDLGVARVFFDVLDPSMNRERVAAGFAASAARIRQLLGKRVKMRRIPELRFEWDVSVERGRSMEALFDELAAERAEAAADDSEE